MTVAEMPARNARALSSGLPDDREKALVVPPDLYRFAENFMFTGYDPELDIALWLHLGTTPDDFGLWEDQVCIALPGREGILWSTAYGRPAADKRPGGANFSATCLEPFRRWRLVSEGRASISPVDEMMTGRVRDAEKELYAFDLEVECMTPAWDAHHNAHGGGGEGSMEEQVWASWHYQQLYRITGTLRWRDREVQFDGTGVRDHSRGQRGHAYNRYGGHNLYSVLFPSGRGFGLLEMWNPEGQTTLSVAYTVEDGVIAYGRVVEGPRFTEILPEGEQLAFTVETEGGGRLSLRGEIVKVMLTTQVSPYGLAWGADPAYGRGIYAPSIGRWEWDGEVGYGLTERSNRFGQQSA